MSSSISLTTATLAPLLGSTLASAGSAAEHNLIANPSFEVRSGPRKPYPQEPWGYGYLDTIARSPFADWGYSGFFDGGDYDIKLGEGHSGKLSARLVCRQRGRGGICTAEIHAKPGRQLRFRGFFKAIGAHGPCFVNFEGDPGDGWERIDLPGRADYDWTEVTGVVTVKPPRRSQNLDSEGNVRIFVFIYTKSFGELWIDDVSLTPVSASEKWHRSLSQHLVGQQKLVRIPRGDAIGSKMPWPISVTRLPIRPWATFSRNMASSQLRNASDR